MSVTSSRLARFSQDSHVLFCYGTLRFGDVLKALLGRIPDQVPASAPGYRAAALQGRVYPGLIVCAVGGPAPGIALTDLTSEEWLVLDRFEDERYELRRVVLSTGRSGLAYIWPGGGVRAEDWDAAEFERQHLAAYAARCSRIAPRLAAGEPKGE